VAGYLRSTEFSNLSPTSQLSYRLALRPILAAHGHRLVRDLPKLAARHIIEEIGATRPGMANLTKSVMSKVVAYAIEIGVRNDNPFAGLKPYRLGTYHTWTDAEIDQYERRWPLGTRERLAFAPLLYTSQRGGDVVKMMRSDIVGDRIRVAQDKARKGTTNELMIRIHPALARALSAGPVVGMQHLITDARGKPLRNLLTSLRERSSWLAYHLAASLTACVRQLYAVWPNMDQPPKKSRQYRVTVHFRRSSAIRRKPIKRVWPTRRSANYRMQRTASGWF
jgi:integrase